MTTHIKVIKDVVSRAFAVNRSCKLILSNTRQISGFPEAGIQRKPYCFRNSLGAMRQS